MLKAFIFSNHSKSRGRAANEYTKPASCHLLSSGAEAPCGPQMAATVQGVSHWWQWEEKGCVWLVSLLKKKKRRLTFNKALAREFSSHPSSCRTGKIEPSHLGRGLPPWKVMHAQLARRVVKRNQTTPARYKGMKEDGILNVGVAKKLLVVKMSGEAKNIHCVRTCFSQARLWDP